MKMNRLIGTTVPLGRVRLPVVDEVATKLSVPMLAFATDGARYDPVNDWPLPNCCMGAEKALLPCKVPELEYQTACPVLLYMKLPMKA